eukprot:CAMPEP_0170297692 /NCGR_PEP_ID=MMETSP0116_2-20130129/49007_1 /TAXON_ID=400756 /ORGANISM="Durinskia baltica, Strain CSIRO CS-38" /LENGTH=78 /DNA_ID=CAMNT_0010549317 /DNA_START=1 /DNA_END=234 /DNA_ORIENTATION=+
MNSLDRGPRPARRAGRPPQRRLRTVLARKLWTLAVACVAARKACSTFQGLPCACARVISEPQPAMQGSIAVREGPAPR